MKCDVCGQEKVQTDPEFETEICSEFCQETNLAEKRRWLMVKPYLIAKRELAYLATSNRPFSERLARGLEVSGVTAKDLGVAFSASGGSAQNWLSGKSKPFIVVQRDVFHHMSGELKTDWRPDTTIVIPCPCCGVPLEDRLDEFAEHGIFCSKCHDEVKNYRKGAEMALSAVPAEFRADAMSTLNEWIAEKFGVS